MSHYFEIDALKALIPAQWLVGALDDDANATAEMFDQCRQAAEDEINGLVSLRYALPLDPVPLILASGAVYIAAEICYGRRGAAESFPFKEKVAALRQTLKQIATGSIPLYPKTGAAAVVKGRNKAYVTPSKIHSDRTNA